MPDRSRALPDRPNLRYLRLEAKRRLAAGEFATLHDAQTAIGREHGQPPGPGQRQACGLGWLISPHGDMAVHARGGFDGTASLAIRIRDNRTHLVLTSRLIPVGSIDTALRGAWTNPEE